MEQRKYGPLRSVCRLVCRRFRGCGPIRSGCLERGQLMADRSDVFRWYPFVGYIRLEAMFTLPIRTILYHAHYCIFQRALQVGSRRGFGR